MKHILAVAFLSLALICGCSSKAKPDGAAGYWEGGISLPGMELKVNVELQKDAAGTWSGKIAIPAQGVRNLTLNGVAITGDSVGFAMEGIPGTPTFAGKLASDGQSIAGDFTQNGQKMTCKLDRKTRPVADKDSIETPATGVAGQGLAGRWQGSLKPVPVSELRLVLDITNNAGKFEGVMVSLDQGNARVPLQNLNEEGGVNFEAPSVGGSFFGEMNTNQSEISGNWQQMGRSTMLVFKRLPPGK